MSEPEGAKMMRKLDNDNSKINSCKIYFVGWTGHHSTCIQPFPGIKTTNCLLSNVSFYVVRLAETLNS